MSYAFRSEDFRTFAYLAGINYEGWADGLAAGSTGRETAFFDAMGFSGLTLGVEDMMQSLSGSAESDGLILKCGCASCLKGAGDFSPGGATAFYENFPQLSLAPTAEELLATSGIVDGPNNDAATATAIEVDAANLIDTINTVGDVDVFKVELVAGQSYDIGMYLKTGAAPPEGSGVPLADAFIELYDAAGNLVVSADGGGPNTPSGLDALLAFAPEASGTYYIHAKSYDQDSSNGTDGDGVGDYEVFVNTTTADPRAYKPFYDLDSPLHSLDWGSEFRRSSRNPDGDNGTRTDNGVTQSDDLYDFRTGIEGKNVITYYFAREGEAFLSSDPTTPGLTADMVQARPITDFEKQQYRLAFDQYAEVADLVYVEVFNRNEADLKILTYAGTPGPGASLLGRASPPGEESEGQMEFNAGDSRYDEEGLVQGGFFFTTLLHEYGHAHGLAHPHDTGGRSSVMRGAGGGTGGIGGAFGDFGLSQGVFTVMSYNDGYDLRPDGTPNPSSQTDYGWVGSLSPLDIAVIQDKYGVNEEYAAGDNIYVMKDENARGTFYDSIWDGGGTDTIRYDGARNTVIDLRAATLKYEEGGGGRVSYAQGINGGFTIANGVVVENARSGAGADVLTGNDADNVLNGGAGRDRIDGGLGSDTVSFEGAAKGVIIDLAVQKTNDGDTLVSIENAIGSAFNDTVFGSAGDNVMEGGLGADKLNGYGGVDTVSYQSYNRGVIIDLAVQAADDGDRFIGVENAIGSAFNDTVFGSAGANRIEGGDGADKLNGFGGADVLVGQGGADTLSGGLGADRFVFERLSDSTQAASDRIVGFNRAEDLIDLSLLDANSSLDGDQAFGFVAAFTGEAGEAVLSYDAGSATTTLSLDVNGDGQSDFQLILNGQHGSSAGFVL